MVVRLALPKLLARAMSSLLASRAVTPFSDFNNRLGEIRGKQEQVNVIRHDDERPETILAQVFAAKQGLDYEHGYRFLPQDERGRRALHPGSDRPTRKLRRRKPCGPAENESWAGCRADAR